MDIKNIEIKNIIITVSPPPCSVPEFPPLGLSAPFYYDLEYYQEYIVGNTTTLTVTGLPTGVSYTTTTEGNDVRLTISGVPTVNNQALTVNANAVSSGAVCLSVSNVKNITPTASNTVIGPVTSNLVQWIDMGNGQAYSGWGNTIQNRSSSNLDYYTVNAAASSARANATVDYTNGGVLRFNGSTLGRIYATTNDGSNNNPIANTGDANWSLEAWFKLNQSITGTDQAYKVSVVGEKWGGIFNNDVHHYLTFERLDGSGSDNILKGGSYSSGYQLASNSVTSTIYPGQYYHAVVTCSSGNVRRLYINGAQSNVLTTSSITTASDLETRIGADVSSDSPLAQNILNGSVAITRYYNKTLSAAEVTQNYNAEKLRFIGGSYSFNGTSSQATFLANTTQFNTNTGDYTYQFWYKSNTASNVTDPQPIWDSTAHKIFFENNTSNANSGYLTVVSGNTAITANISRLYQNNWTHFAISRTSNVTRIFMNGTMQKYTSDTSNANTNANSYFGFANISNGVLVNNSTPSGNFYLAGEVTNFYFNANTGLYTNSGYTMPSSPTGPVDSTSNVKLLLKATDPDSYQIDSSPRIYTQNTTVWTNVAFSTSSPFAQPLYSSILRQEQFTYTGNIQTWTVPNNVSTITVTATGARGGDSTASGVGGNGASINTRVSVTPGSTLYIVVGGAPNSNGIARYGYGGNSSQGTASNGGGGGGLSGVFTTDTPSIANAIVVAGGGGGGGGNVNGGSAGVASPGTGANGGGNGGGVGGTNSTAGAAGTNGVTQLAAPTAGNGIQGGRGGAVIIGHGGGGGGGGYYGAGAGAGGNTATNVGGGGGGASYSTGTITYLQPFDLSGNGVVIINYTGLTPQ